MKRFFIISIILTLFGFSISAESKVMQKCELNNGYVRWIHNMDKNLDYIELCRSENFDEVVYRFVASDSAEMVEFLIPILESDFVSKIIYSDVLYDSDLNDAPAKLDMGIVLSLFLSSCDTSSVKKYYNLGVPSCLIVYSDCDFDLDIF